MPALPVIMGALGAAQIVGGLINSFTAKRPKYRRPDEINTLLSQSEALYKSPVLPGQQAAEDALNIQAANALSAAASGGDVTQNVAAIQANLNAARNNLAGVLAQQRLGYLNEYSKNLEKSAEYSDLEFQMNKFAPYKMRKEMSYPLLGSGTSNIFNAIDLSKFLSLVSGVK